MLNRDQNDQHFISHKSTNTLLQQKCRLQRIYAALKITPDAYGAVITRRNNGTNRVVNISKRKTLQVK